MFYYRIFSCFSFNCENSRIVHTSSGIQTGILQFCGSASLIQYFFGYFCLLDPDPHPPRGSGSKSPPIMLTQILHNGIPVFMQLFLQCITLEEKLCVVVAVFSSPYTTLAFIVVMESRNCIFTVSLPLYYQSVSNEY